MRRDIRIALYIVGIYLAAALALFVHRSFVPILSLTTPKKYYLHYEIIPIEMRLRHAALHKEWMQNPPDLFVLYNQQVVTTIGGLSHSPMRYDPQRDVWTARWPCPWNAPTGFYQPMISVPENIRFRASLDGFYITRRKPKPLSKHLAVLTFENVNPLGGMKVKSPSGENKGWQGLLDWTDFTGANAFWILGGLSPGNTKQDPVWVDYNMQWLPKLGKECHSRGLEFGIWTVAYMTRPGSAPLPRYEYAVDFKNGDLIPTRAISLRDQQRVRDLTEILQRFEAMPEVDAIGLDYIRNALGGYELVDDFVQDMPGVRLPSNWNSMTRRERMIHLALRKIARKDHSFIDQWQWWRAHRVAQVVESIKRNLRGDKPLWCFTLTWEKGWHHGQDPVMMNDAGVDIVALMMYEATREQFDNFMGDWNRYVKRHHVQLIVGDVVDWPLHQYTQNPTGPQEFYNRLTDGINHIYGDGKANGVFLHDLGRALWGRKGPYSTKEWLQAGASAIQYLKKSPPP